MIDRPFWMKRIAAAWRQVPIVWLTGVRRSGKTTLAQGLGKDVLFLNCDLPSVEDRVRDPELFYRDCGHKTVVFDEIHQLKDPSRLLKIGADMFPGVRILATGSSTLAASRKFRDTLTGRKRQVHLVPVLFDEFPGFPGATLQKRLYQGGLPPALLAEVKSPAFYREWADSYFSRDVAKLFAVRDPDKFNRLFEYLLRQSGGLMETAKTASALGLSRPTVASYLRALEITHAVTVVRPFFGGGRKELVKTPKVYGFDTGFISFFKGWDPLRPADCGHLWEHMVLEHLLAHEPEGRIQHWRDAAEREVDFVVARSRDRVDALECKWDPAQADPRALKAFRERYPRGENFIVSPVSAPPHKRRLGGLEVTVCSPSGLPVSAV